MPSKDALLRRDVELAYCEVQALRRRLLNEPRTRPEVTARSLVDTITLLGSVSAQLRTIERRNKQSA